MLRAPHSGPFLKALTPPPLSPQHQPLLCSHFSFSTSRAHPPHPHSPLHPHPVVLSASFFFIALVLVFCDSTPEGETTKGRVSMAPPSATRLVSLLLSFLLLFFSHLVLFSFFFTACFDLGVKELLIHCQTRDLRGCRGLKRNCIFNRVCVCVCMRDPFEGPCLTQCTEWMLGFRRLMGDNMWAAHEAARELRSEVKTFRLYMVQCSATRFSCSS